jgi:hypothetical protein
VRFERRLGVRRCVRLDGIGRDVFHIVAIVIVIVVVVVVFVIVVGGGGEHRADPGRDRRAVSR